MITGRAPTFGIDSYMGRFMLEDESELKSTVDQIVANMLAAKVAEKKSYTDERLGKEYWNLITPGAFDKKLVVMDRAFGDLYLDMDFPIQVDH